VESVAVGGFSPDRTNSKRKEYESSEDPLDGFCKNAGETIIKSIMIVPEEHRITDADSSINEAASRMLSSGHDYLFVREGRRLTGIVSLSDIVGYICDTVRACRV
jgi:hypothetical protein